jgi:hypothetical protein
MKHLIIADECKNTLREYDVDECLWNEILIHYVNLRQTDANIGECFKLINDNLHKRCSNNATACKTIDRLTEINKIYAYLKDVCTNDVLCTIKSIDSNDVAAPFIELVASSNMQRINIIDFLNEFYETDLKNSDLSAEVWTKMRPLSDEGKTRGYSGPAELPLLLFAGGCKADKGDILINNQLIEIKGEGGRIGEYSKWCNSKTTMDTFFNQFNRDAVSSSAVQIEFAFDEVVDQFVNNFDSSMLPYEISCIVKQTIAEQLIKTREDALMFIGCIQLTQYMCSRNDDWFVLFKHPGKKTAPFGTSFVINAKQATLDAQYIINLMQCCKSASVSFSPCYDSGGYKIKFLK